ncbi:tRNA wybutosine-synthesizing protein 2 homolog [Nilaparvata lugens]|uniref:tRNA wybutosine-synthesizing protein 2 homolog n=1 Tax=Nilaparvata lugens TaxID=108931 RepID=UPI00193CDBA8|nr:tRNA wybutosine-synthesizing protein 2 homolog [Nilaparvata lugens]XP_022199755.2 tRNA wybutosine-synthesizing protein 2 homolog [Nilaparvata lugens]
MIESDFIAMNNEIPEPQIGTKRSTSTALNSKQILRSRVTKLMLSLGLWREQLAAQIPTSWEKFDNCVLFNEKHFQDGDWSKAGAQLWKTVADVFGVANVAIKGSVERDKFRTPRVRVVFGESNLVRFKDNGVIYTWDTTKCMFSRGNVSERHRVAKLDCRGETIVDLFAGIGYFTLPFLVKSNCQHLHACEWNPSSIQSLKQNLKLNKVDHKCTIHEGDNRLVCPRNVADRVNLGLIPTSRDSWEVACLALKSDTGGVLHVHENVNTKQGDRDCECEDHTHVCAVFKCETCVKILDRLGIKSPSNFPLNDLSFKLVSQNKTDQNILVSQDNSTTIPQTKSVSLYNTAIIPQTKPNISISLDNSATIPQTKSVSPDNTAIIPQTNPNLSISLDDTATISQNTSVSLDNSRINQIFQEKKVDLLLIKDTNSGLSWKKYEWFIWALHTTHCFGRILSEIHRNPWIVSVNNVHHVKSYAPYIEHMVIDLECRPTT